MILGIIPARFGSKGIPRKNIIDFCGKPLIQFTIEAALGSELIDEVIISTDDIEVNELAKKFNIDCAYKRPDNLASDSAAMSDVVLHLLNWYKQSKGMLPDKIVLLQPTSPLRKSSDIDGAIRKINSQNANSLISVHKLSEHPYECIKIENDKWAFLDEPSKKVVRRQDFDKDYYFINGAIYILSSEYFLETKSFYEKGVSILYEIPRERGIDIDTPLDLIVAKSIYLSI